MHSVRQVALGLAFDLLYGPLVLLHEAAGKAAFGAAWSGRRLELLCAFRSQERIADVGAGSGLLAAAALRRGIIIVGVDPSTAMRTAASRNGATVLPGCARNLPFPSRSIDAILVSYPGPWIFEQETAREFGRVLAVDGRLVVLLGGTVQRGSWSGPRHVLHTITYGRSPEGSVQWGQMFSPYLDGGLVEREDTWGTAFLWTGRLSYPRAKQPRVG